MKNSTSRRSILGRIAARAAAVVAAAAVGITGFAAAPSQATVTDSTPILLVHGIPFGIDMFTAHIDCNDPVMSAWKAGLRARGLSNVKTVGYYANDTNCDLYVPSRGDNTMNTSIWELGREFATLISTQFTARGVNVGISAHSMGGLVTRAAIAGVDFHRYGFPYELRVSDVVTSSTPHGGSLLGAACGSTGLTQCLQMMPFSQFLNELGRTATPQGSPRFPTQWSLYGSDADLAVLGVSATALPRMLGRPLVFMKVYGIDYGLGHGDMVSKGRALNDIAASLRSTN